MTLYWLSFADPKKPKGKTWLGATMVEVNGTGKTGLADAIQRACDLHINPGGEIKSFEFPRLYEREVRRRAKRDGSYEQLVGRAWAEKHGEKM